MTATIFTILRHLALGAAICLACTGCTVLQQAQAPYPVPERLTLAPSLQQDFVQEFLAGRWCAAQTLFMQAQEYYLRQDDVCSVAQAYVLAYKLHAYLDLNYPHLLDKAKNFAQQGLDCTTKLFDTDGQPRQSPRDTTLQDLIDARKWQTVLNQLKRERDPLFASVYARKAARQARRTDIPWTMNFLKMAREIDGKHGWVLFLIQDWKLQQTIETRPERRALIGKRITSLYDLVDPCNQPFSGQ